MPPTSPRHPPRPPTQTPVLLPSPIAPSLLPQACGAATQMTHQLRRCSTCQRRPSTEYFAIRSHVRVSRVAGAEGGLWIDAPLAASSAGFVQVWSQIRLGLLAGVDLFPRLTFDPFFLLPSQRSCDKFPPDPPATRCC